jgi:hypothetical protein
MINRGTPNVFGNGPTCIVCHSSNDPSKSYRGLDLSSCEGILRGAVEESRRAVIVPGKPGISSVIPYDGESSRLYQHLTENRMPPGVSPSEDSDHANTSLLMRWIEPGSGVNSGNRRTARLVGRSPHAPSFALFCHL